MLLYCYCFEEFFLYTHHPWPFHSIYLFVLKMLTKIDYKAIASSTLLSVACIHTVIRVKPNAELTSLLTIVRS